MKKQQAKMITRKRIPGNKALVYGIIILAVLALVGSSILAAFVPGILGGNPQAGNPDAARQLELLIDDYTASLKSSPNDVYLLTELGNTYYQLGLYYSRDSKTMEKSIETFAKALDPYANVLEQNPGNVNVRVDRAVAAFYSNNYEEAQKEFQKAIELEPTHVKAHFNYGFFLYYGQNKPYEAIDQWEEVIALNPADDAQIVDQAKALIATVQRDLEQRIKNGEFLPTEPDNNDE